MSGHPTLEILWNFGLFLCIALSVHVLTVNCENVSCNDNPCKNGGTCFLEEQCSCPHGTRQPYCDIVDCSNSPCYNGECMNNECHCGDTMGNFVEPFCAINCSRTQTNFCKNGGTCSSTTGICVCRFGYTGQTCEEVPVRINPCPQTQVISSGSRLVFTPPLCYDISNSYVGVSTCSPSSGSYPSASTMVTCQCSSQPSLVCMFNVTVEPEAPLSAPSNVSAFVESSRQINLTWEAPPLESLQGIFVDYVVRFREKSATMDKFRSTVKPSYELTDLKPYTTYMLSVAVQNNATNDKRTGPFSKVLEAMTEEDIPSEPVNLVEFKGGSTDTQFVILWSPPRQRNGEIVRYHVYSREEGEEDWTKRESMQPLYAFLNLKPFTKYEVKVSALTRVGEGPNSTTIVATTDVTPATAPRNVTVTSITNVSALITWGEPSVYYNRIDAYIIKYWEAGQSENFTRETVQIGNSKQVFNLIPGRTYIVTVAASTPNIKNSSVVGNESTAVGFTVLKYASIKCPAPITLQYQDVLSYDTPTCLDGNGSPWSISSCTPRPRSTPQTTQVARCECDDAPDVFCNFQIVVTARLHCPAARTVDLGAVLSFENPLCETNSSSMQSSCTPVSESVITTDTVVTCICRQEPTTECTFDVFVDCTALRSGNPRCNDTSCQCSGDEVCDSNSGSCSRSCSVFGCPAGIESKSLSTVNPFSSVMISCSMNASTTVLDGFDVRLSKNESRLVEDGIVQYTAGNISDHQKNTTFRVASVTGEEELYCVLMRGTDFVGGVRVPGFVYVSVPEESSAHLYLIILIIIPVFLVAVVVFFIIRYQRKNNSKNKKTTKADHGEDSDYVNAAVVDDAEGYIPLETQPRSTPPSKYEDIYLTPQSGVSTLPQYEVTIFPKPQKPVAAARIQTDAKEVESGAHESLGASSEKRQLPDVPQTLQSGDEDEDTSYEVPDRLEEYTGVYVNVKNKNKPAQPGSIKVAEFQKFMIRNKEDVVRDIVHQFMALPSGGKYPWNVALKFQNKPRNFYKTVLPYDHSRVKLDTAGSDARSDYINANYIKNPQGKTSFIAAQGPRDGTVDDFWRMVWQENVEIMVMVTDNFEKNKLLCCTYWPSKVHMGEVYGDITVILMESTIYTTHTTRKLNLLKGNQKAEVHTVTQIQVHSWPYGGVPEEATSLVAIIKKLKTQQLDGSSSTLLVHCSNGVGATGTFIAACALMDIINKNKDVSVFDFVKQMRDDRVDMVQTRIQYFFIFEFLLAALQSTDSQMSCDQLKKLGHAAIKQKCEKEFKVLQESVVTEQHSGDCDGNSPENQHKNRFSNLIPEDNFRPVLKSQGNTYGSNSYINAFHLPDFGGREFIMTQTPLASTVEDFWRLVFDYECTTVVMLNTVGGSDKTVVQYWPGGGHGSAQYGLMTVECVSLTKSDSCIQSQFQVAHRLVEEKSLLVNHFAFCGWSGNEPDVSKLLSHFIRYTRGKNSGPVLVHCINGVGLSAVYVIAKTESDKMEQEGFVDVFQSLKKLRKNCPLAIQKQEEYALCYQLLKDHLDNPEDYLEVYYEL